MNARPIALLASFLAALAACTGKSDPDSAAPSDTPALNLALSCVPASPACDNPGFDMAVLGDIVESCETQVTSIRLQLKSSDDTHDLVVVAFDGYHGPDTYSLDTPGTRFVSVDVSVQFPQCEGGPIEVGKRVSAADPNCGSPACTVDVGDASPTAAFPKPLTFAVRCESLCENGSDVTCAGPIAFTVDAECT